MKIATRRRARRAYNRATYYGLLAGEALAGGLVFAVVMLAILERV